MDDQTTYGKRGRRSSGRCQIVTRSTVAVGQTAVRPTIAGLPADLDVLFFGGIAKAAPLLRALRTAGRSQLFASGDGCWDLKGFVQKAQGAATSGAGVQILSAASSVGRLPGSADFAAGDQARYRPNLAAIETATRQAGGLPTHARVLVALQASHFRGSPAHRP